MSNRYGNKLFLWGCASLLAGCCLPHHAAKPLDVSQVTTVEVDGDVNLTLSQNAATNLQLPTSGMKAKLSHHGKHLTLINHSSNDTASLTVKDLKHLQVNGDVVIINKNLRSTMSMTVAESAHLKMQGFFKLDHLEVKPHAEVQGAWLTGKELTVDNQGYFVELGGEAERLVVHAKGHSQLKSNLKAQHIWVESLDHAKVSVSPQDTLFVTAHDHSQVIYQHDPLYGANVTMLDHAVVLYK